MAKNEVKKDVKKVATKITTKSASTKTTKKPVSKKNAETKKTLEKRVQTTSKASTPKKNVTKKASEKNASTSKKSTSTKSVAKKTTTKKTSSKSTAKSMLSEYYDLPYRYNQTIVKILAQTPTTLFVYWDISDEDRDSLVKMHGDNFFYETRPILLVHNLTRNYTFEIEINDFANSWYIRTGEPDCDYIVELGRKFNNNSNEYIYINSSNDMMSPNDHILFENADLGHVLFRNVKTHELSSKDFGDLNFIKNIDKLYGNIYDVYSALYNNGELDDLNSPSSHEFYLKQKKEDNTND